MFLYLAMLYTLPYLTTMLFVYFVRLSMIALQKQFVFHDFSDINTERLAENFDAEILLCSPPISNPSEYAEYMVKFMKNLMNKYFTIRIKTITQRRLHFFLVHYRQYEMDP